MFFEPRFAVRVRSLRVAVQVVVDQVASVLDGQLGARQSCLKQAHCHVQGEIGCLPFQVAPHLHDVQMRQALAANV